MFPGKKNWKKWVKTSDMTDEDFKFVSTNKYTYAQIYSLNKSADVTKINAQVSKRFNTTKQDILQGKLWACANA